ncbi:MAG: YdcF family protein [Desulfobacteraceae bacterium]|jgi:uncharacterized SAM-binding protein YcdF (DUF218 family)
MSKSKRRALTFGLVACFLALLYILSGAILTSLGEFLVFNEKPAHSEAAVVLCTGIDWYPRVMEAAALYRRGLVEKVVINGNRKSEVLRRLEKKGFERCCPWYEEGLRILELSGVPRKDVIALSAEDAYDTVSEAKVVGKTLVDAGMSNIIITTSKYHTRRARHIWKNLFPNRLKIQSVAARHDPFSPKSWWKDGRQIRCVLSEYGAWIYYFWKNIKQ